jgi:23S rRNA pseudouridine1911/1915/1917 synthase
MFNFFKKLFKTPPNLPLPKGGTVHVGRRMGFVSPFSKGRLRGIFYWKMGNKDGVKIIYEDDYFLAIDKPSGLVVHTDNRVIEPTLVDWVRENYLHKIPNIENVGGLHTLDSERYVSRWGIVNRLDRDTSGVILIAKDNETFIALQKQFLERTIIKEYKALVWKTDEFVIPLYKGVQDLQDDISSTVDVPIQGHDREQKLYSKYLITTPIGRHRSDPRRWAIGAEARNTTREAITEYKIDKVLEDKVLVTLWPKTGRTHQLRLHMNAIGTSIVGDKKYGLEKYKLDDEKSKMMLHAHSLTFIHPKSFKEINISCQVPNTFLLN